MGGFPEKAYFELDDLKKVHRLEFITMLEEGVGSRGSVGFAKGKIVVFQDDGYRCRHEQRRLEDALYQLFKSRVESGDYDTIKRYVKLLSSKQEENTN